MGPDLFRSVSVLSCGGSYVGGGGGVGGAQFGSLLLKSDHMNT